MNNDFEKDLFENNETEEKITDAVIVDAEEPVSEESETELLEESVPAETVAENEFNEESSVENKEEESEEEFSEKKAPGFNVTHNFVKKEKKLWPRVVALSLVAGIVFGAAFGFAGGVANRFALSKIRLNTAKVELNKGETPAAGISNVSSIAEACMPSIVAITNRSVSDVMTFFGKYSQESTSSGSGIIVGQNDTELLIVTNYHVIANSQELSVVFSPVESKLEQQDNPSASLDNEDIPNAIVKGYDAIKDLAVIAVNLKDIPTDVLAEIKVASIGDSSLLKPGDQVVAIGNALGYGQSVTTGIISAVNRKITMESADGNGTVTNSFIQTDAAINSGNSGGALLDMAGNLIGINSVKIATTGVEGMGYAIPITDVEGIIDDLMVRQTRDIVAEDKQGFLGITGADVTAANNQMFGIPVGVFVNSVVEGLAAEKAGIKKGYVITKFDGYSINTIAQLQDRLQYYKEGERVSVIAMIPGEDGYKEKDFTVILSNRSKNIDDIEKSE